MSPALNQQTIAAESCQANDKCQVSSSTTHCNDDCLHHVEIFILLHRIWKTFQSNFIHILHYSFSLVHNLMKQTPNMTFICQLFQISLLYKENAFYNWWSSRKKGLFAFLFFFRGLGDGFGQKYYQLTLWATLQRLLNISNDLLTGNSDVKLFSFSSSRIVSHACILSIIFNKHMMYVDCPILKNLKYKNETLCHRRGYLRIKQIKWKLKPHSAVHKVCIIWSMNRKNKRQKKMKMIKMKEIETEG